MDKKLKKIALALAAILILCMMVVGFYFNSKMNRMYHAGIKKVQGMITPADVPTERPISYKCDVDEETKEEKYSRLLGMYPEKRQGYGLDTYIEGRNDQAMTYGLVLSAEAIRYNQTNAKSDVARIREATQWLINNRENSSPAPGWGISAAWDAFSDGSENPADQPYTITGAIVIEGLLDALTTSDVFSSSERDSIHNTIKQVFDYYLVNAWTDLDDSSGYFWYSPNENDNYFTPNVSSAFLGVLSRYYKEYEKEIDNVPLFRSKISKAAQGIIDNVHLISGMPFWDYAVYINKDKTRRANDLVHHAYTLWGIESYRENIGEISIPWGREDAVKSLNSYWKGDDVKLMPQDSYEPSDKSISDRPVNLWGAGAMLGLYAKWNDIESAHKALCYIDQNYGIWPGLTLYPVSYSNDKNFYSRHGAHVLWGLAYLQYSIK